jgi:hypothetical protein
MSANESGDSTERAVANLQREVIAMRQILTLLLAHRARHSAMPNALDDLKGLLDEVYSGDAVEEEVRDKIDQIIGDANTLVNSIKGGSLWHAGSSAVASDCLATTIKTNSSPGGYHATCWNRRLETFVSEYERWQARFSEPGYAFGKEPNYSLKSCAQLLPRSGRALAIADGEGRNGIWLAEQGLEVLSIDFSPLAQAKARVLAAERGVKVNFELADVHTWQYPEAAFDVVVEIFTQFSSPGERRLKWAGMRRTL